MYLLLFSFGLMYKCFNGAITSRKYSIKVLAKWRNYFYVLTENYRQRRKWLGRNSRQVYFLFKLKTRLCKYFLKVHYNIIIYFKYLASMSCIWSTFSSSSSIMSGVYYICLTYAFVFDNTYVYPRLSTGRNTMKM